MFPENLQQANYGFRNALVCGKEWGSYISNREKCKIYNLWSGFNVWSTYSCASPNSNDDDLVSMLN